MIHGFQFQNPQRTFIPTPDEMMRPPGRGNFGPPQVPDQSHQYVRDQLTNILNAAIGTGASDQWASRNQIFNKALIMGGLLGMVANPGAGGAKAAGKVAAKTPFKVTKIKKDPFGRKPYKWSWMDDDIVKDYKEGIDYHNEYAKDFRKKHGRDPVSSSADSDAFGLRRYNEAKQYGLDPNEVQLMYDIYGVDKDLAKGFFKDVSFEKVLGHIKNMKTNDWAKLKEQFKPKGNSIDSAIRSEKFDKFVQQVLNDEDFVLYKLMRD